MLKYGGQAQCHAQVRWSSRVFVDPSFLCVVQVQRTQAAQGGGGEGGCCLLITNALGHEPDVRTYSR